MIKKTFSFIFLLILAVSACSQPQQVAVDAGSVRSANPPQTLYDVIKDNAKTELWGTFKVVSVTDGDMFKILEQGQRTAIRLIGCDTPEIRRKNGVDPGVLGAVAKDRTAAILAESDNEVILYRDGTRKSFDRQLAHVVIRTKDGSRVLSEMLVAEGLATAETGFNYSQTAKDVLKKIESEAKKKKIGIWADEYRQDEEKRKADAYQKIKSNAETDHLILSNGSETGTLADHIKQMIGDAHWKIRYVRMTETAGQIEDESFLEISGQAESQLGAFIEPKSFCFRVSEDVQDGAVVWRIAESDAESLTETETARKTATETMIANIQNECKRLEAEIAELQQSLAERETGRADAEIDYEELDRQIVAILGYGCCSLANYNHTEIGMTKEDVIRILGADYEPRTEYVRFGRHHETLVWKGEGRGSAVLSFVEGVLKIKTQSGLK
jgi:endonuclease YncB( thermonuclease family)